MLFMLAAQPAIAQDSSLGCEGNYKPSFFAMARMVSFTDKMRENRVVNGQEPIQVFYDREGSHYPTANVHVPTNCLVTGVTDKGRTRTLKDYFQRLSKVDPQAVSTLERDAQIAPARPGAQGMSDGDWVRIQNGYRNKIAKAITKSSRNGQPVVFLVHGFRNDNLKAYAWYKKVDADVRAFPGYDNATLVHVYWDGTDGTRFLTNWGNAQANMPDVGLEVRRLLNDIPTEIPVRFITHSTGMPLVANALGDASAAFRNRDDEPTGDAADPYYARASGDAGSPFDGNSYKIKKRADLRFGAIAPAATPKTFDRYRLARDMVPSRIVMALHPRDSATGKAFMHCGFWGDSCMAVRPRQTCEKLVNKFEQQGTAVHVFDFQRSEHEITPKSMFFWTKHSIVNGYDKNERWQPFLSHLLEDKPQGTSDTRVLCQVNR
jgi:hypothetical protein